MSDNSSSEIKWEESAREKFDLLIAKVPVFMREIASGKVTKKAEAIVSSENRDEIIMKDMVDAFFEATPFGFHGPMKADMEEFGIDYVSYGHPK